MYYQISFDPDSVILQEFVEASSEDEAIGVFLRRRHPDLRGCDIINVEAVVLLGDILATHDIVAGLKDTLGRTWCLVAWPRKGGVVCYFSSLAELRKWERDMLYYRKRARGELTLREKMYAAGISVPENRS